MVQRVLTRVPGLWLSRSWTTRSRRPDDAPDAYTFVDRRAFEQRIAEGGFLEWEEFLGELYGTPVPEIPPGHDLLLEIELQGARQVKAAHPEAVLVFVVAPSREEQAERLRRRGDPEDRVQARLAKAEELDPVGRAMADHVVVNDDLDRAADEVADIFERHRSTAGPVPSRPADRPSSAHPDRERAEELPEASDG